MHLIKWSTVTKTKNKGGLGIRDSRQSNIALLAKIGGQLVAGSNALWARVIRSKYIKSVHILDCFARPTDSRIWKGLAKVHGVMVGVLEMVHVCPCGLMLGMSYD